MNQKDTLKIGEKIFNSRLMIGTGKYQTPNIMIDSLESSKSEIITVAIEELKIMIKTQIYFNTSIGQNIGCYLIPLVVEILRKQLESLYLVEN